MDIRNELTKNKVGILNGDKIIIQTDLRQI